MVRGYPQRGMNIARFLRVGTFLLLAALCACRAEPDEARIGRILADMQSAIEAGDADGFMQHVADDFSGDDAGMDQRALKAMLGLQMLGNQRVGVQVFGSEVEVSGDRATVTVTVLLTGGNARWLPERGGSYRITSGWRRDGDDWLCIHARWERLL